MNVVIFGKGFDKPRQLNLSVPIVGLGVSLVAAAFVAGGFLFGAWHAEQNGSGISTTELARLHGQIESQRNEINSIRQENEDTLDALSIRIAQMNARVIRLDALGRRLTKMADIDDSEFDFDSDPAVGGPEEPPQRWLQHRTRRRRCGDAVPWFATR